MAVTITVNGKRHTVAAPNDTPLLYVLRNELNLTGPKFGCGLGQCGACTVHVGDVATRSCVMPLRRPIANSTPRLAARPGSPTA